MDAVLGATVCLYVLNVNDKTFNYNIAPELCSVQLICIMNNS